VIENHFILATKTSKPQTGLLEPDDLSITYACLQAWARDATSNQQRRLFAFFNSGEHSGASQAHRHIQFIALEDMAKGGHQGEWQLLIDTMTSKVALSPLLRRNPDLPFLHYATELPAQVSAEELHSRYMSLLGAAIDGSKGWSSGAELDKIELQGNRETAISYNLGMTTHTLAIVPRRSETALVTSAGETAGSISINGTILGGTLMVKDDHEYSSLKEKPSTLDGVLTNIGFPVSNDGVLDRTKL
jgi:ATP adenylyltransferase